METRKEIYFDNGATTRPFNEVREIMDEMLDREYGNPSSMHQKGFEAEKVMTHAREAVAKSLKVNSKEIYFTSGGTEANNLALIGTALAHRRRGKHIITSCVEHASVYNPLSFLEDEGFEVTYLPVDEQGIVSLDALKESLRPDTILVSVMNVNNEIGAVEPIEEIGTIVKNYNRDIVFHTDCIQSYGKYVLRPRRMKADMISVSGHKIHGPKGIGFLYIKNGTKIRPILYGGNQQTGIRSGTENMPGIAGLGKAVEVIYGDHEERTAYILELKQHFLKRVLQELDHVKNNSGDAPHIVSISFPGVRSEVLLHALEDRGIYVSAGSACSSNKPGISGTLKGIGLEKEYLESTLRFSFSAYNTIEETDYCVDTLKELVPVLRKFVRR